MLGYFPMQDAKMLLSFRQLKDLSKSIKRIWGWYLKKCRWRNYSKTNDSGKFNLKINVYFYTCNENEIKAN